MYLTFTCGLPIIVSYGYHLDHAIYLVGLVCVQCAVYTACMWALNEFKRFQVSVPKMR